jgi:hypothetical protein
MLNVVVRSCDVADWQWSTSSIEALIGVDDGWDSAPTVDGTSTCLSALFGSSNPVKLK